MLARGANEFWRQRLRALVEHAVFLPFGRQSDLHPVAEAVTALEAWNEAIAARLIDEGRSRRADDVFELAAELIGHGPETSIGAAIQMATRAVRQEGLSSYWLKGIMAAPQQRCARVAEATSALFEVAQHNRSMAACALAIRDGWAPASVNLREPDPDAAALLPGLLRTGRDGTYRRVLSTSFGFGGLNAALVFGAVDG
jgi:hypothetical protein